MRLRSTHSSTTMPVAPPVWTATRALVLTGVLLLVFTSFWSLQLEWRALFTQDALSNAGEFLSGFASPDLSASMLAKVGHAALETLSMSALGTLIAAVLGLLLALPASGRFGKTLKLVTGLFLNVARSIPELVWASMMLIAAGLGPFAGTIALAAHTTGVFGRLFAESLDNSPPEIEASLRINGASATQAFLYSRLPQALPQMLSYTLYRWENNIRAAAILGVVGAGGLGQMMKYHLSLFQMSSAATVILAMLLLVAAVDALSFSLRRWLVR
jgi:phosphonate transport system permease protein